MGICRGGELRSGLDDDEGEGEKDEVVMNRSPTDLATYLPTAPPTKRNIIKENQRERPPKYPKNKIKQHACM
jgi:hypothetical protein